MPNEEIKTITNTGNPRPGSIPPRPFPGGANTKPPPRPQGRGNLIYVCAGNSGTAVGGVAKCVGAYSSTPVWSAINSGLTTAAQKNFYSINFDPFSYNGTQFTRMLGLNQDGLYLCTGLNSTPTWAKKLDAASASSLLGKTVVLGRSWTPNVRKANQILILAYETVADHGTYPGTHYHVYTLWSNDLGANWSGNSAYYIETDQNTGISRDLSIYASYHKDNTYYITGSMWGTQSIFQSNHAPADGTGWLAVKATTLPQFSVHYYIQEAGRSGQHSVLAFPYTNPGGGAVYTNDDIVYVYKHEYGAGTTLLYRYNSFNTTDPGLPALRTAVGSASMSGEFANFFFPHTFNENYIIGAKQNGAASGGDNQIWVSTNRGSTWTLRRPNTATRTNLSAPMNLYLVLADEKIFYTFGHDATGNIYVGKTLNTGAAFTDVSNYGTTNSVDTILGTAGLSAARIILVDYYKA